MPDKLQKHHISHKATIETGAICSIDPITLCARSMQYPIRVTAPLDGTDLPVLIFCHGANYSRSDYRPMIETFARGGFIVIQPSHPDEFSFEDNPRVRRIWHDRVMQVSGILDCGEALFEDFPPLAGRTDWTRVVCAGHSYGGHTVANVLGARAFDEKVGEARDLRDHRICAGAILAAPGNIALDSETGLQAPFMNIDFSYMDAPALVIAGKQDDSTHVGRDWTWHSDAYTDAPGPKSLLILPEAKHYLHGITGKRRKESGEEDDQKSVSALAHILLDYLLAATNPLGTSGQSHQIVAKNSDWEIRDK